MESPARKRLQRPFSEFEIGQKFQMVNNVMKAALPSSRVFTKTDEHYADGDVMIRPNWLCEEVVS